MKKLSFAMLVHVLVCHYWPVPDDIDQAVLDLDARGLRTSRAAIVRASKVRSGPRPCAGGCGIK